MRRTFAFVTIGLGAVLLSALSGCDAESDRHASNRALHNPVEISSAENEVLTARDVSPLLEVDMPNKPGGQVTVISALDPVLGRQPPAATVIIPTISAPPFSGVQLQPITAPTTGPATAPATQPFDVPRGGGDSTTPP